MKKNEKNDELFSLNKIKYILGKDLDKAIEENRIKHPSTSLDMIIDTYVYLLKSLKKLEKMNILHYDLKANNIMYDKKMEIPIIIDFGLSIPLDKINPDTPDPPLVNQYFFDTYKYDYWCIDVIFIGIYGSFFNTYLEESGISSKTEAIKKYNQESVKNTLSETFNTTLQKYINYVFFFSSSFLSKCKLLFPAKHPIQNRIKTLPQVFYQKWQKYIEDNESVSLKEFFNGLWKARQTWDRYSLSVIYISFICESNPIPLEEHILFMNETDRTTVALLWHENIANPLSLEPKYKALPFYSKLLENICFADYIGRITFQSQIWQFNEMSSLIKTFYNNRLYHDMFPNHAGKFALSDIDFTKVLTKYSTEYNNQLFLYGLCQKMNMDKNDLFAFFQELRVLYSSTSSKTTSNEWSSEFNDEKKKYEIIEIQQDGKYGMDE
jgi:serine/threonine protein kinase